MPAKHPRPDADATAGAAPSLSPRPTKRPRLSRRQPATLVLQQQNRTTADLLTPLSDELLLRILTSLSPSQLLHSVALVSRRFHRLAHDSQLWKALYYARFVLPRALRIPGFRDGRNARERRLHYKGRRTLWADGRLGGLVSEEEEEEGKEAGLHYRPSKGLHGGDGGRDNKEDGGGKVNWMRQFKIRHNWARGKCAVEELKLGPEPDMRQNTPHGDDDDDDRSKMLVKVVEGLAVTADAKFGFRAWDLKTREVVAQIDLRDERNEDESPPSCMAIDDRGLGKGVLDISIGFTDGSFGVWRLGEDKSLNRRYRHEKSSNGGLIGMAYSHPYLLTATGAVLVSLYTFDIPEKPEADNEGDSENNIDEILLGFRTTTTTNPGPERHSVKLNQRSATPLPAPYLMTSLRSHTSDPPLALSIRKTGNITVASIAYTFFTRQGWSIGIQDLHITPNTNPKRTPPDITTRLAYTTPVQTSRSRVQDPPSPHPSARSRLASPPSSPPSSPPTLQPAGPTTLSYTHPYLLATLPDNTLLLHLCTSTAAALSISPVGIRLWGHTSGISDAEITARGKAVSVSSRGDEMRVWELEGGGRPSGSVAVKPGAAEAVDWDARRNWVGFDDEMVIVLKEARGGRESLLVYDFT
ncbi:unnamed protein product [Discula destructiva]